MGGSTADTLWIGLDLGTSSLKAVALDAYGRAAAEARQAYATMRPGLGRAEQRPEDWAAALAALSELAARLAALAAGAALPSGAGGAVRFVPDPAAREAWQRRSDDYERLLLPLRRIYRTWPGPDASEDGQA